jgi:tripartite-type tricarboxylate transporter receptor subunit TctC
MKRSARLFSILGIVLLLAFINSAGVRAQEKDYPNRPITIIVPFTAGGGVDVSYRALANEIQKPLGQPVLVECKPGAGGIVGGDFVAKAKPDGYTLGAFGSTSCDPELYAHFRKASYTSQDLRPVVRYFVMSHALVTRTNMPWNNLKEFMKYVKDNPNKVRWGHPGIVHPYHILGVMLSKKYQLEMVPVPFKGAADIIIALLGGHIESGIASVASAKPHVESGKMIVLAVQNPNRVAYMPDAPTFADLGFDLGLAPYYNGLFVPKGTPDGIVKKLHDTVKRTIESQTMKDFAYRTGIDLYYGDANDLINDMKKDREVIGSLLKDIIQQEK